MLKQKHVVADGTTMTLRNELGDVIARYDRVVDQSMCAFLDRMIAAGEYTGETIRLPSAERHAA